MYGGVPYGAGTYGGALRTLRNLLWTISRPLTKWLFGRPRT